MSKTPWMWDQMNQYTNPGGCDSHGCGDPATHHVEDDEARYFVCADHAKMIPNGRVTAHFTDNALTGQADKDCSVEGVVDAIFPLDAERPDEPERSPPSADGGESFLVANDECPLGCGVGLSVNYGAGREQIYCPECGWSVKVNAESGRIADRGGDA